MTRSLGESGFSVAHAGHWLWHRPHSVHVARSRSCFQLNCSIVRLRRLNPRSALSGSMVGVDHSAPERGGLPGEGDVQGGEEDVEVFE